MKLTFIFYKLRSLLTLLSVVVSMISYAQTVNTLSCDNVSGKNNLQKFDPYLTESLPLDAPAWMRRIAEDPHGVNFNEMQRLFKEWNASDVNVRVKTVDKKPAVNFYRRWMAAYRNHVAVDGSIILPTIEDYAVKVDDMNRNAAQRNASITVPIWRNIGPNRTYANENGEMMPGRYASISLKTKEIENALAIPSQAIVPDVMIVSPACNPLNI